MPRAVALTLDQLTDALRQYNQSVGPAELERKLGVSRATLNRRLQQAIAAGRVKEEGSGRAVRYRHVAPMATPPAVPARSPSGLIVLQPDSAEAAAYIGLPSPQRAPAGYERSLVDDYTPNATAWLPQALRRKLERMGRVRGDRPAGTYAREILSQLLIDLSWASSRLEGNRYTRLDTQRLIEEGVRPDGTTSDEAVMILNHKAAIEFLVDVAPLEGVRADVVSNLHALLGRDLIADSRQLGAIRTQVVSIGGSRYLPPQMPQLLDEMFRLIVEKARLIADPLECAFFLMVQLPYLQPFVDANKRTSRLASNIPLVRDNFAPLSFVDVQEEDYAQAMLAVYERRTVAIARDLFEWAYERSVALYNVVKASLPAPDAFRMRHRLMLNQAVQAVVAQRQPVAAVVAALELPNGDRARFEKMLREELLSLHSGNFARYLVSRKQFEKWEAAGRPV